MYKTKIFINFKYLFELNLEKNIHFSLIENSIEVLLFLGIIFHFLQLAKDLNYLIFAPSKF